MSHWPNLTRGRYEREPISILILRYRAQHRHARFDVRGAHTPSLPSIRHAAAFLADRTAARRIIGSCHDDVVRPSVYITLCIVALRVDVGG